MGPGFPSQLCLTSWVALSKSLNLPEPQSVHLQNGGSMPAWWPLPQVMGIYETKVLGLFIITHTFHHVFFLLSNFHDYHKVQTP